MTNENKTNLGYFFQDEYQSLKGYVRSKIDDTTDGDAEDIIQDVAVRIFSRPDDALPITNITGFVYHAVRNKIIDVMRTKKRREDDEEELEQLWTEFSERFHDGQIEQYPKALRNQLKSALAQLKPEYRDIILAIDFEGYTYREIAEESGISPGTLMSRRHRALSILAKQLNAYNNE